MANHTPTALMSTRRLADGGGEEVKWRDRFLMVREFVDFMGPLFQVLRGTDTRSKQHYLAVPPDASLEESIYGSGRINHAAVRSHIIVKNIDGSASTLLGSRVEMNFDASLDKPTAASSMLLPPSAASVGSSDGNGDAGSNGHRSPLSSSEAPPQDLVLTPSLDPVSPAIGSLVVTHGSGKTSEADILRVHKLKDPRGGGSGIHLLIVNNSIAPARERNLSERLPGNARASIRMGDGLGMGSSIPIWQQHGCFSRDLLINVETDADNFREIISMLAAEKSTQQGLEFATANCDAAMTHLDVELAMFTSSYVCMPGFEDYIVAKVNQIAEGAIEKYQDITVDEEGLTSNEMSVEDIWDDDQSEEIVVAFHTLVTGGVAPVVLKHWQSVNEVDDIAFHHACVSLGRRMTVSDFAPTNTVDLDLELCNFETAIDLMVKLSSKPHSVFSCMRLMESVINKVVEAVAAVISDVTADICIPLVVFVIVSAQPRALPSLLKFLMDFMIPILEMSSLGYSYTTFEAAAAQVMEEYISRVRDKV